MEVSNKKPKILIVDDQADNLFALEKILKKQNADVIRASSGNEALSKILYIEFALIILDVQMPEMDGYEVAEILKSDKRTEDIPIIFVTAIDRDSAKEIKGYTTGAVDFIFKPMNEFILVSKVKIFLEIYRMKSRLEMLVRERTLKLEQVNTDLLNANSRLRKSESQYRTLFEKSNDAIFIVKKDTGDFWDANQAAENLTGRTLDELKQMAIQDAIPDGGNELLAELSQTGTTGELGRVIYQRPNNELRITNMSMVDLDNLLVICIAKDITHDMEVEKQLRQSHKMESIGTLAGGIAHDFNNILFSILGYTELLIADVPEDSLFRPGLDGIYSGATRAKDLVRQILTFSRQENIEVRSMKIQPIINESLKIIRPTFPSTIEIRLDIKDECGMIIADSTQIHQIIMNLTTNAYHAMLKTGGVMELSLRQIQLSRLDELTIGLKPGSYACLAISDTGPGIDKDQIDKIFDPFFTTKEKGKGTGMGLSVVHGIVQKLGGGIRVESKPGQGTRFDTYFPITEEINNEEKVQNIKQSLNGNERILLVDDEEGIINVTKKMLGRLGYHVTAYSDSLEALENFCIHPHNYDIVITDMTMPNMPGDKLSIELLKKNPDIPILLFTGYSEVINRETAIACGIKGFLSKPINTKDLAQKIREVLDKK